MKLELTSEDMKMLLGIAFTAFPFGYVDEDGKPSLFLNEAGRIFNLLKQLRPNQESPYIGLALTWMMMKDIPKAIKILRSAPPSPFINAFLALALAKNGDKEEAKEIIADILETPQDKHVQVMVQEIAAQL